MKKTFLHILVLLAITIGLNSCEKFLEEKSQDEIRPTTIADLTALMNGEAYPSTQSGDLYLNMLTDEVSCNGTEDESSNTYISYLNNGAPIFKWDPSMFDGASTALLFDQDSWQKYYEKIMGCNLVKDYVDKVTGTDKEKKAVLGQVLFLRAYYYFKLVNIYGQPYNNNPTTNLGVPLMLSSIVSNVLPQRNTVAEVYAQIEADLLESADLLKDNYTPSSVFRVSHLTAYALLSRMYLYMEDFDEAIEYANLVIAEKPDLTLFKAYFNGTLNNYTGVYDVSASQEILWVYGANSYKGNNYLIPNNGSLRSGQTIPYTVSETLLNLYDPLDLRSTFYFAKFNGVVYNIIKCGSSITTYGDEGMRLAEVYLNRAEALIRRGQANDLTQALSDLNTLRISRYDTRNDAYVPVLESHLTDGLLAFCKEERRRELCLEEGHRWFDMKRWGEGATHVFKAVDGGESTYTLQPGSLLYALPIPHTAMNNNGILVQNPR